MAEHGERTFSFHEDKKYVGWGEDLEAAKEVSLERTAAAGRALGELVSFATRLGCREPLLVGTNTLREARNSHEVISALTDEVSLPISVLSQKGEAAMGFLGASSLVGGGSPAVLIDLGGTSTEVSWGTGGRMDCFCGVPLGTHRIARLLDGFPQTGLRQRTVVAGLTERVDSICDMRLQGLQAGSCLSAGGEIPTIIATGGTAVSLAVVLRFMKRCSPDFVEMKEMTIEDLELIGRRINGLFRTGRERTLPLEGARVKLLVPGLIIFKVIAARMGISHFKVTTRDLRWGVVLSGGRLWGGDV